MRSWPYQQGSGVCLLQWLHGISLTPPTHSLYLFQTDYILPCYRTKAALFINKTHSQQTERNTTSIYMHKIFLKQWMIVAHAFNPSSWEAEQAGLWGYREGSRTVRATQKPYCCIFFTLAPCWNAKTSLFVFTLSLWGAASQLPNNYTHGNLLFLMNTRP